MALQVLYVGFHPLLVFSGLMFRVSYKKRCCHRVLSYKLCSPHPQRVTPPTLSRDLPRLVSHCYPVLPASMMRCACLLSLRPRDAKYSCLWYVLCLCLLDYVLIAVPDADPHIVRRNRTQCSTRTACASYSMGQN